MNKILVQIFMVMTLVVPTTFAQETSNSDTAAKSDGLPENYERLEPHRCEIFRVSGLSDSVVDFFVRERGNRWKACCVEAVTESCNSELTARACRGNVNQSAGSCPTECKRWARACADSGADISGQTYKTEY